MTYTLARGGREYRFHVWQDARGRLEVRIGAQGWHGAVNLEIDRDHAVIAERIARGDAALQREVARDLVLLWRKLPVGERA